MTSNDDTGGTEVQFLTSSRDLDDYDILSTATLSVAVPHKTTESFRKLIWAAMVTYGFGNSSVDHVMRRYGFLWERRQDKSFERDRRILALREIAATVDHVASKLERAKASETLGRLCARSALCRLEATFKAAYGLVRKEYVFETDAVVRLILEQLAWAYAVFSTPEEGVSRLQPTKCISKIKAVFPECGTLYGKLSEWAHIDASVAKSYLAFHKADIEVVRRSAFNSFESGAHVAALAPIYLELAQMLFSPLATGQFAELQRRLTTLRSEYDAANN